MGFFDIFKIKQIKQQSEYLNSECVRLSNELARLNSVMNQIGYPDHERMQELIRQQNEQFEADKTRFGSVLSNLESDRKDAEAKLASVGEKIQAREAELQSVEKKANTSKKRLSRLRELYTSVEYCYFHFLDPDSDGYIQRISTVERADLDELVPSVLLKLHSMDVKSLRAASRENDKEIEKIFENYASRYTTKANKAIYSLMVIALRAELQNILTSLKYNKLDDAVEKVQQMTAKYLKIAGEGNQSIAGTLERFIGQIEYLFINAVKIEYNYYVKREQAKQEQAAIREQMRQEAEERKALEAEKKKIEAEERKFQSEIAKLTDQAAVADDEQKKKLEARMLELQAQLSNVAVEKERIVELANGRAGNVYIISNLGAFGENMFKVGMTRRSNPQERVDELGDASVPFRFDVHSFIFSHDAVGLENKLHEILDSKRVNKVNRRKEFFYSTVDDLEKLVLKIEPTAEFNKTMIAEEFRQSLSSDEIYTDEISEEAEEE